MGVMMMFCKCALTARPPHLIPTLPKAENRLTQSRLDEIRQNTVEKLHVDLKGRAVSDPWSVPGPDCGNSRQLLSLIDRKPVSRLNSTLP